MFICIWKNWMWMMQVSRQKHAMQWWVCFASMQSSVKCVLHDANLTKYVQQQLISNEPPVDDDVLLLMMPPRCTQETVNYMRSYSQITSSMWPCYYRWLMCVCSEVSYNLSILFRVQTTAQATCLLQILEGWRRLCRCN